MVLLHLFEDTLPLLGHIIGVVHPFVRQLQELDGFVVGEVLKIQLLHRLFAPSSVFMGRSRWIAP